MSTKGTSPASIPSPEGVSGKCSVCGMPSITVVGSEDGTRSESRCASHATEPVVNPPTE